MLVGLNLCTTFAKSIISPIKGDKTEKSNEKKVLLIGWDAADWKIINQLIAKGEMPAMQRLKENGVYGNLLTLDPPFSPMLWTTIATGKLPDKHGILGFTEPTATGKGISPVASTSRKVKAIWNILTQEKLKSHVVGWWPSHPAEPINGVMISNHYQSSSAKPDSPLKPSSVFPSELAGLFAHLKVHPAELPAKASFHKNYFLITENKKEVFNLVSQVTNSESKVLKDPIIVVSGLPRSGTSLMMQILESADFNIFTDKKRGADVSNPKGYYEYELVKNLARDKSWLPKAKGKAVKVIAQLLKFLPAKYNYKIIFMEREIKEVMLSQQKMLISKKQIKEAFYSQDVEVAFLRTITNVKRKIASNYNMDILFISHQNLITNPVLEIDKVRKFLAIKKPTKVLAEVVQPHLYRAKF